MNNLELINAVIEAHHGIREKARMLQGYVNDLEAVLSLQKVQSGWNVSSEESLKEKRGNILETLGFLENGLRSHFAFEEKSLPRFLGEFIMKALLIEHAQIKKELVEVRATVIAAEPDKFTHEQLLAKKWEIQEGVSHLHQTLEEHAGKEDTIFKMIKNALEKSPQAETG